MLLHADCCAYARIRASPALSFQLSKELPPRTVGHTWQLAYSTSHHGSSLKSLYRKLSATDSPVLIVIKDALDEVERVVRYL